MKRNELTPDTHVLVAKGQGWESSLWGCERYVVLDARPWVHMDRWGYSHTRTVTLPDGRTVRAQARLAQPTEKGAGALLMKVNRDGTPMENRSATVVPLGQIRGPWDLIADVERRVKQERAHAEQEIAAQAERRAQVAQVAARLRVAVGEPDLFLSITEGRIIVPVEVLARLLGRLDEESTTPS